ncbi:MAG: hypothetical protein ACXWF8_04855 [Methylobacter sp.]
MAQNDNINNFDEEDLELQRFVKQGNKLKWTWVIGSAVIVFCLVYGDASQWVLAFLIAVYIYFTTRSYFKSTF